MSATSIGGSARALAVLLLALLAPAVFAAASPPWPLDAAAEDAVVALDCDDVPPEGVQLLAKAPAPRILSFKGSLPGITMDSFGEFLVAMGYPAERIRNPADGSFTYGFREDDEAMTGRLAWYYERDGMVPMLVGHSAGGVVVDRILYDLADADAKRIRVWNVDRDEAEPRSAVSDPWTGESRRIAQLRVPWATMFATGKLLRAFLGQARDIPRLRAIPDSAEAFVGYLIPWDPIAGTGPNPEPYRIREGTSRPMTIRNVVLDATTSHIRAFAMRDLAKDARVRAWIERYRPDKAHDAVLADASVDVSNAVHAADIWHSVRKHWCLEVQRVIRARRGKR